MVPELRVQKLNEQPKNKNGKFVLYWMTANRRTSFNFALDRAIEIANELGQPLLVVEILRSDYEWACDRFHQFVIEGMVDNQKACKVNDITYLPLVEQKQGDLNQFLDSLASKSSCIVTDDYPAFFYPALLRWFGRRMKLSVEAVDSVGLLPTRFTDKEFKRAHFFRNFTQQTLKNHLHEFPEAQPFDLLVNKSPVDLTFLHSGLQATDVTNSDQLISSLAIDHSVRPLQSKGGNGTASTKLEEFLSARFQYYIERRNRPQSAVTSELSGYLHFGQISSHQIFDALAKFEDWNPGKLAENPTKKALGWWGMSPDAETFLDQLVVWRELGFNMASKNRAFEKYSSLPNWAKVTLDEHRKDVRDPCYSEQEFEDAQTDDALWNAAQNQLRNEGKIHNYLRMLWGKKILHWADSPEEALRIMIQLNNKYAIDGRDPNSYSGIFWILGRYDRAWGPERKIFGKIRYMTSDNTARKFPVKEYIEKYS